MRGLLFTKQVKNESWLPLLPQQQKSRLFLSVGHFFFTGIPFSSFIAKWNKDHHGLLRTSLLLILLENEVYLQITFKRGGLLVEA